MAARKPKRPRIELRASPARKIDISDAPPSDIEAFIAAGRTRAGLGTPSERPLTTIRERPAADTRTLNLKHVGRLAVSIRALGLIEPIVVDAHDRLIAGGHRLAACRVLAAPADSRLELVRRTFPDTRIPREFREWLESEDGAGELDPEAVPVRVVDFDASADPERALTLEAAENEQRRDYSSAEVRELYRRLIQLGFTDRRGRPRRGERPARPVVAAVVGRSLRHLRRVLETADAPQSGPESGHLDVRRHLGRLERSVAELRSHADLPDVASILDLLPADFEARVEAARVALED